MSPFLSIAWLGFDRDLISMRAAIAEMHGLAADLGETIGEMTCRTADCADADRRLKVLRAHRFWLMEQAEKFHQRLDAAEAGPSELSALVQAAASLGSDDGGRV